MPSQTIINWLSATLIALLLSSAWLLDGPSDLDAARDVAADVQDAVTVAQAAAAAPQAVQP